MSASCNRASVFRTRRSVARRFRPAMIISTGASHSDPEHIGAWCPVLHAAAISVPPCRPCARTFNGNDEHTADADACDGFPMALWHAGLSVGLRPAVAVVAIAAHPGLLTVLRRPPAVFLGAIVMGIALNREWPLPFVPTTLWPLGAVVVLGAVSLFLLSFLEFRAAGTWVQGHKP